jgi:hypothetical protein
VFAPPRLRQLATPHLLNLLNSTQFRTTLRQCCGRIANWSAHQLLDELRANVASAELLHQWDGGQPEGNPLNTEMPYVFPELFANQWQAQYVFPDIGKVAFSKGPDVTASTPLDEAPTVALFIAEQGLFRLPYFEKNGQRTVGAGTFRQASTRLKYASLNMLRASTGFTPYGNVTAVFSPSYWADAVAVASIDSGTITARCNETIYQADDIEAPNAPENCGASNATEMPLPRTAIQAILCVAHEACSATPVSSMVRAPLARLAHGTRAHSSLTPPNAAVQYSAQCSQRWLLMHGWQVMGVAGAMDHVLLNNHALWASEGRDQIGGYFARWFGESDEWNQVSMRSLSGYMESNVLANVLYAERGIKLCADPPYSTTACLSTRSPPPPHPRASPRLSPHASPHASRSRSSAEPSPS